MNKGVAMRYIKEYKKLLESLPIENQSSTISKTVWKRVSYKNKQMFEKSIFGDEPIIEISRNDIFEEQDLRKKIFLILIWGYPTAGRGNNIQNLLENIDDICSILEGIWKKDISKEDAETVISRFNKIKGLGISTWSKFLYFFEVSIDSNKCQIFDQKIVVSLNKRQFQEIEDKKWTQSKKCYYEYLEAVNSMAKSTKVSPDRIELFFFLFNLEYKFE